MVIVNQKKLYPLSYLYGMKKQLEKVCQLPLWITVPVQIHDPLKILANNPLDQCIGQTCPLKMFVNYLLDNSVPTNVTWLASHVSHPWSIYHAFVR